ncbi:polypeptide N-acetylgalactosaminyltransferase 11-like isoform X3 [Myxocyprinus asiaticus]|uniref:polypeptide N-acetylgalactosaminyltransferase 11-like isoform X3 n=1 Tax=Myxocyprinus asiaticus TaxID=70543 RepID=UPI002223E635|nr:polypeptide N-acetylgalactosaminyltransferase 11-like isoform X3 [Myxocyprinus asiaticus]
MGSVTLRYFCYGCLFTSVTWSILLFLYFNHSQNSRMFFKNVPIQGQHRFQPRFTRSPAAQHRDEGQARRGHAKPDLSPELGMIFNKQDQEVRDMGYHKHAFNVLISNRLGYHRDIADTRNDKCRDRSYPMALPTASVVICFFNEAFSALLRTVHSVLDRTPNYLLHEIILVDDHSELDDLKEDLDVYIQQHLQKKVKLVRNERREGLIRGRMIGASHASDLPLWRVGCLPWTGTTFMSSIWMCGGQLLIMPCSRVGHIFRKRRPYGSPGGQDTMAHNSLRLAHVWMDEYKEQYFALRPELRNRDYGDISERVAIRKRQQCHSFKWYLDNIYPEMQVSSPHKPQQPVFINKGLKRPKVLQRGRLRNLLADKCLVAQGRPSQKGGTVVVRDCDPRDPEQEWAYDEEHELILAGLLCLDMSEIRSSDPPRLMKCHGSGGSQQWTLGKNNWLYQVSVGQCLAVIDPLSIKGYVAMAICDDSQSQQWLLES